jgi:hypothetical protein
MLVVAESIVRMPELDPTVLRYCNISIDIIEFTVRLPSNERRTVYASVVKGGKQRAFLAQLARDQVESLNFGTVQITVHESKVVQIERNEKTRLDRSR